MKVGEWVAISEAGLWVDIFDDNGRVSFPTKKEAIDSIASAKLDAAKKPNVRRISQGKYIYRPKDCDTGYYGEEYAVERVTEKNIENFESLAAELDDE